ncbi:MAG TPA: VWA domain-containing protein [Crocinitomicaceae bacterium]|nr:VWA domain-containing protein [Crocinitomicaceae bacterium]
MRILISIILVLFSFFGNSQIKFNTIKHDFGDLEPYSSRYVDIILENYGSKEAWVLSVKKPMEVAYIISKQIIPVDSATVLRFQVNPRKKGKFSYEIMVFTSNQDEATSIKLTGNLLDLQQDNTSSFTACPTFNDRPGGRNSNDFDLTVVTIDKETKEELSNSTVTLIQGGQAIWAKVTDRKGKVKEDATLGLSYFYATHEGYYPAELGSYVNFKRNFIVLELEKDKTVIEEPPVAVIPPIDTTTIAIAEPPVIIEEVPVPEEEIEIIIEVETHLEEELEPSEETTITVDAPPSFTDLDREDFSEEYFNPINVVFVLDVSSSMKQVDKIELMKYSLMQLTDMLRPQDKFAIVTYANDARVLLKPTSGAAKEEIKDEVKALKAFGYTSGGSGIKLGYKTAKRAKISNGTNHVIIITDGAFNRNSDDYKRYIKKYRRKGITMSVVGVRNKTVDEEDMKEAAQLGGGRYVPIMKLSDAQHNLKQEIRLQSYKF